MIVPFLAVATLIGVVVVPSAGWRRLSLSARTPLPRAPWLLLLAILPQLLWTRWLSHLGPSADGFAWVLPVSYLPVLCFIALNLRFTWARVVAVGVGLNVAVMLANGGTMPAPAHFARSAPAVTSVAGERVVPGSKDRIVADSAPAFLAPLQDQYVVTLPGGQQRLTSVGDFVTLGGAVLGLLTAL
ncbi:MAG TPA: DUF5317 family protein [Chloroflexota bacterium]|nr:DUF5317 family protein [Chloroflexota bacterium]